jgi:hypothetical protein
VSRGLLGGLSPRRPHSTKAHCLLSHTHLLFPHVFSLNNTHPARGHTQRQPFLTRGILLGHREVQVRARGPPLCPRDARMRYKGIVMRAIVFCAKQARRERGSLTNTHNTSTGAIIAAPPPSPTPPAYTLLYEIHSQGCRAESLLEGVEGHLQLQLRHIVSSVRAHLAHTRRWNTQQSGALGFIFMLHTSMRVLRTRQRRKTSSLSLL